MSTTTPYSTLAPSAAAEASKPASFAARLFAPVDIAPLVWFRIVFGLIMLWEVFRYFQYGRVHRYFVAPTFYFKYYGFGWVEPWPGFGMEVHFIVLGLLAAAIAAGVLYRVTTVLFFFAFTYVFLLDQTCYLNHFYLVCLYSFLMILVPAHRAFSVDASVVPRLRSPTAPAWSLWILRAQMCIVYFMGGIAKLNADWLRGEPMRIWLGERSEFPLIGRYFHDEWMVYCFSYGGLLFDLFIPLIVILRRTRWIGFALALFFNLMNSFLFDIGIFPWLALGATVLLFFPRLPHPVPELWGLPPKPKAPAPEASEAEAAWENEGGAAVPAPVEAAAVGALSAAVPVAPAGPLTRWQMAGVTLLATWLAFQLLVPLRHLVFYPGNPEWTEEGHRFAWRMKLRSKDGTLDFVGIDPATGHQWDLEPTNYVTQRQFNEGLDRPDIILQLAHHIAAEWKRKYGTPLEVYARAEATLNGRRPQKLIDPKVNLAAEPRTLAPAHWILPLTTPLVSAHARSLGADGDDELQMKSIPVREPARSLRWDADRGAKHGERFKR